jgi:hypothetical protein
MHNLVLLHSAFAAEVVEKGVPVVLTDTVVKTYVKEKHCVEDAKLKLLLYITSWKALTKWTPRYLAEAGSVSLIDFKTSTDPVFTYTQTNNPLTQVVKSLHFSKSLHFTYTFVCILASGDQQTTPHLIQQHFKL